MVSLLSFSEVFQPEFFGTILTVWNFKNFCATQILREIEFGLFWVSKTATFKFNSFCKVKIVLIYQNSQFLTLLIRQSASKLISRKNMSCRKIVKFPHWVSFSSFNEEKVFNQTSLSRLSLVEYYMIIY